MYRILCYGDSNTWGYIPAEGGRFSRTRRWTGVLAANLGENYEIIEEGLNGRTTVWDDPVEGYHKNGLPYFKACLESHEPLDLVIIMLGTNDLKQRFSLPASDIADGASSLAALAMNSKSGHDGRPPKMLMVSPIEVHSAIGEKPLCEGRLGQMFGADSIRRSQEFRYWYQVMADEQGYTCIHASDFARPSPRDAIHLDAEGHLALGTAIAEAVRRM